MAGGRAHEDKGLSLFTSGSRRDISTSSDRG